MAEGDVGVRVGLARIDGKWPNLALMKLSAWHKAQGDQVERYMPLGRYDLVYASKVFDFTPDVHYLPADTLKGGTGYDLTTELPSEVEACRPDYSLYPDWKAAIGFTTRGCIRQCPFCVVPRKEGNIRIVGDLYSFWQGQRDVILLDNNLTAAPMEHFKRILEQCIKHKVRVDFSQGLDLRLTTTDHTALLARVSLMNQIHFAWDRPEDEYSILRGLGAVHAKMPYSRIMVYVLIGYDTTPEQDLYRVQTLRRLGIDPFVMPYRKRDLYQRRFARWVNHKAIFKSVDWRDYGKQQARGM